MAKRAWLNIKLAFSKKLIPILLQIVVHSQSISHVFWKKIVFVWIKSNSSILMFALYADETSNTCFVEKKYFKTLFVCF